MIESEHQAMAHQQEATIEKAKNEKPINPVWLSKCIGDVMDDKTIIANESQLFAIRSDVTGETTSADLTKQLGTALKPLTVGPQLLQYLDQSKRLAFLKQWKDATAKK